MVQSFYFSPTGNTRKIVNGILEGMSSHYNEHDLTFGDKNAKSYEIPNCEMTIVGVPVYAGRIPEIIIESLKKIRGNGGPAIAVVTYGNRAYEDALLELVDLLKAQNFKVVAAAAFVGEHSYTNKVATKRPDNEDMITVKKFAKDICAKLAKADYSEVNVPGNRPYRERSESLVFAPVAKKECVYCRKCPVVCPTGAIDMRKPDIVDETKCIHCCACIKVCTFDAREIRDERVLEKISLLETNFIERKEPELFI